MALDNCSAATLKNVSEGSCLALGRLSKAVFSTLDFSFADADAIRLKANWDAGIASKDLFVFPTAFLLESQDVDPVFQDGLNSRLKVDERKKITQFSVAQSVCVHKNMRSFDQRIMRVFEITEDGFVKGVLQSDGTIKGQQVTISVDAMTTASATEASLTNVSMFFSDINEYEQSPLNGKLAFNKTSLRGIVDLTLAEFTTGETSSLIKISVTNDCTGDNITTLVNGNLVVTNAGVPVAVTGTTYNATDNVYELASSAAFANGDLVSLNGVVSQPDVQFEGLNTVTIAGI